MTDLGWLLLDPGEKVYAQPTISNPGQRLYRNSERVYRHWTPDLVKHGSTGSLIRLNMTQGGDRQTARKLQPQRRGARPIAAESVAYFDVTFDGRFVQLGRAKTLHLTLSAVNPIKTLWWRTLDQ